MRDPTRGGLATVLNEIQRRTGLGVHLIGAQVPIRDPVQEVCEMFGYDPFTWHVKAGSLPFVSADDAPRALERWRGLSQGHDAACIGELRMEPRHVVLETELGGQRVLEELEDDPLPRIC